MAPVDDQAFIETFEAEKKRNNDLIAKETEVEISEARRIMQTNPTKAKEDMKLRHDFLERSADLVHVDEPSASPLQPLLNLAFLEAFRFAVLRFESGIAPSVGKLHARLVDCGDIIERHGDEGLLLGMTEATRTLFHVLKGLAAAWSGDLEAAAAELQWCDAWQARDGRATWRNAPRTRPTQGLRRLDALSERLANRSKRSVRAVRPETAHRADQ